MEEAELEEGEAFHYKDDFSGMDPDVSLSYIEEKLHNVLGHFTKDFEGWVSVESLGGKCGEYGSFLPMHQRSPSVLHQRKTPQRVQTYTKACSNHNFNLEDAPQHSTVPSDVPLPLRSGIAYRSMHLLLNPKVISADISTTKDSFPVQVAEKFPLKHKLSASKLVNPLDQRSLKVRIKVGSGNTARKNSAIYSGLGLSSPSSSAGNGLDENDGMATESPEFPRESPGSILQSMTSFPVPGSLLLSPLHENLLCLVKNENIPIERKLALPIKGRQKNFSMIVEDSASMPTDGEALKGKKKKVRSDSASMPGDGEALKGKKKKCKSETLEGSKYGSAIESEDNKASHSKRSKGTENVEIKQRLPNDLKIKLSSNPIMCNFLNDPVRSTESYRESGKDVPVKKREIKKDWRRDNLLTPDNPNKESLESIYSQDCGKYERQDVKSSSMEHIDKQRVRSTHKDFSVVGRDVDTSKSDFDVSKGEKENITVAMGSLERKIGFSSSANQLDEQNAPYSMESLPVEGKEKLNTSQKNGKSAGYLRKERVRSGVQASKREKKSAQTDAQMLHDSYKDVLDTRSECTKSQMMLLERPKVDKTEDHKLEEVNDAAALNGGVSIGALPPEMAIAVVNSQACKEDWVCCDQCEKWRLLPYGASSSDLPETWLCSMLTWLPGMNRCDISEDDTTNAIRRAELENQINLQNGADRAASGVTSANFRHFNQKNRNLNYDVMPNQGKKRRKLNLDGGSSDLMHTRKLTKAFHKEASKSRSLNDMNQPILYTTLKVGNARNPSNMCNFGEERHSPKQYEKHLNGGDMKHKQLKNKRESDQSDHGTFKKIKIEAASNTNKNWTFEHDKDSGRVVHKSSSGLSSRSGVKDMHEYSESCYSKNENHELKDRLVISVKKQRDSTQVSLKSGPLDGKTYDEREIHAKKRKLKDWEDSQDHLETLDTTGNHILNGEAYAKEESNNRKLKKEKNFSIGRKESNDKSHKKSAVTKIRLAASRDNSEDKIPEKDQQRSKHRETVASQGNLDDAYSLRKCMLSEKISLAATSSSSKVSGSHRTAGFQQEIRGSPVESVSSSPMRVVNVNNLSAARGNILVKGGPNAGDLIIQSPRKKLEGEVNGETNLSGTARNRETSTISHFESSGLNVLDYHDSESSQRVGGRAESRRRPLSKSVNSHLVHNVADTLTGQRQSCTNINVSNDCDIEGRISKKHQPDGATFPQKSGKGSSSRSKDRNRSSNLQRVKVKVSNPSLERESVSKIHMDEAGTGCPGLGTLPEELTSTRNHFSSECNMKVDKDGKFVGKKVAGTVASDCRGEKPTKFRGCDGSSEVKSTDAGSEEGALALRDNVIQESEAEILKIRVVSQVETAAGKHVNQGPAWKGDELLHVRQPLSRSREGSGFDVHPDDSSGDRNVSKVLKQHVNASKQSGVHQNVRNLAPELCMVRDLSIPCAMKEDTSSQVAKIAVKEAESAKKFADRLKESGFSEQNDAYFEAALKFLHCASLLEACGSETSRREEMDPIQIYSITAKLCETCAQEYEKRKEMAAAVLAYKCMEVAYLKLAYCKNSSTNRDRHDLQACLQMIPQDKMHVTSSNGESPSSSASDVDNLNNQATKDKAALSRGIAHTGNHIVVARNHSCFMRVLDFANDVNYAMEASRKSQNALAAASVLLEDSQNKEGIISVKRVIDFSFQDIEELVHLVRNASKAISHPG